MFVEFEVVSRCVVCRVEVVCVCWEFGGECIDSLDKGCDTEGFTKCTDLRSAIARILEARMIG
jgi:hypothetical protein